MARAGSSALCFRTIVAVLFGLTFAIPRHAVAYVGLPYLTPAQPTADDVIEVSMYKDNCEVINGGFPEPVITQQGSRIIILLTGAHEDDPLFCIYGVGVETNAVGRFPPGFYTLDVERRYTSLFTDWVQEKLGDLDFAVTESAPSAVAESAPTLSTDFLFLLTIATSGIAMRRLHFRGREAAHSIR